MREDPGVDIDEKSYRPIAFSGGMLVVVKYRNLIPDVREERCEEKVTEITSVLSRA